MVCLKLPETILAMDYRSYKRQQNRIIFAGARAKETFYSKPETMPIYFPDVRARATRNFPGPRSRFQLC